MTIKTGFVLGRYGFVVYADPSVTDIACAGLNGMRMGERTLTVRRATEVRQPGTPACGVGHYMKKLSKQAYLESNYKASISEVKL